MSNFLNVLKLKREQMNKQAVFGAITENTINTFPTKDKKTAGFQIVNVGDGDNDYYISQVYDSTDGYDVYLCSVSVENGTDLTGGLFDTGCFCNKKNPLDSEARFYLIDY